jgi:hypothetical protein
MRKLLLAGRDRLEAASGLQQTKILSHFPPNRLAFCASFQPPHF